MKDISDIRIKGGINIDCDFGDKFNRRLIVEKKGNSFPAWTSIQVSFGGASEVKQGIEPVHESVYTRSVKFNESDILTEEMKERGWKWV